MALNSAFWVVYANLTDRIRVRYYCDKYKDFEIRDLPKKINI